MELIYVEQDNGVRIDLNSLDVGEPINLKGILIDNYNSYERNCIYRLNVKGEIYSIVIFIPQRDNIVRNSYVEVTGFFDGKVIWISNPHNHYLFSL